MTEFEFSQHHKKDPITVIPSCGEPFNKYSFENIISKENLQKKSLNSVQQKIFAGFWHQDIPVYSDNFFINKKDFFGFELYNLKTNHFNFISNENGFYIGGLDKKGFFSGRGFHSYLNGFTYSGEFQNGLFHFEGQLYLKKQILYSGQFFEGKYEGKGTLFQNGQKLYHGRFMKGIFNGQGTLYRTPTHISGGIFIEGKQQGNGFLCQNEIILFGNFINGKLDGKVTKERFVDHQTFYSSICQYSKGVFIKLISKEKLGKTSLTNGFEFFHTNLQ